MEIVAPQKLSLVETGTTPVFIAPAWATGQWYSAGTVVRRQINGVWRDCRAEYSHTSSNDTAPENSELSWSSGTYHDSGYWQGRGYSGFWTLLGPSSTSGGITYATNVRLTLHAEWSSGAISEGEARHDSVTRMDYRAVIAMTSGENTMRPSQALLSSDEIVRSRWMLLGAGNAWAPFDYLINSYLIGRAPNGSLIDPEWTCVVDHNRPIDRICFAGLRNVSLVEVGVRVSGILIERQWSWQVPQGARYGVTLGTASIPIQPVAVGAALTINVKLTRLNANEPAMLGVMCVGQANHIAATEWGVETSIIPFSRKARDPDFGVVEFLKRGSARAIKATAFMDPNVISGDVVQSLLTEYEGAPVFWDFNNTSGGCASSASPENRYAKSEDLTGRDTWWGNLTYLPNEQSPRGGSTRFLEFTSESQVRLIDHPIAATALKRNAIHTLSWLAKPVKPYRTIAAHLDLSIGGVFDGAISVKFCLSFTAAEIDYTHSAIGHNWNARASCRPLTPELGLGSWSLCTIVFVAPDHEDVTMKERIILRPDCETYDDWYNTTYSGDTTNGILVSGMQVNVGVRPAPYVRTEGTPIISGDRPDYERLRAFGFYSNMSIAIPAHSFESLSLDVEGLVE